MTATEHPRALKRLRGKVLCRTVRQFAGGYDYFTEPDHAPFDSKIAEDLIATGEVQPNEDGLFPGMSQTFVVRP